MASVAVPTFVNACIAPDRSGTAVWLLGVSPATEGLLEAYLVNLSNINSPTATLVGNQNAPAFWSSSAQKACFNYYGNSADTNSPIIMQQFQPMSYFTNIYANGTVDLPTHIPGRGFVSPKTFSLTGSVGDLNWYAAVTNITYTNTGSSWTSLRYNATALIDSDQDFVLSQYPTSTPLVSVGTFVPSSNTPAQGYHIVFDSNGGGKIYTALSTSAAILTSQDRVMSLSYTQDVDMNGITLTTSAISVTMVGVGYILDAAPDASTVLYSINPSQSSQLQRISIQGNVPPFSSNMVVTALNSRIVVYGATNGSVATATLNSFDTVGGSWSGPGLVAAYVPTTNSTTSKTSKAPIGAIIGGVVGGLVLIAIVALLVVRSRRNSARKAEASSVQNGKTDNTTLGVTPQMQQTPFQQPLMQQQYQQQQQQQQQQYNLHQQYVPVSYSPVTEAYAVPPQQQNPMIFQSQQYGVDPSQQSYSYVPPTLAVLPQQQQQPNIFQPQSQVDVDSKPSYSQTVYTPSAATPQTPYTLVSQTQSSGTPSSPQYIEGHPNNQGYVA